MNTVDKGLDRSSALGWSLANTFASCSDKFSHASVCKKHELFDEPVRFLADLLIHVYRATLFIHHYLHFRSFEADGSTCESLASELCGNRIQDKNGIPKFCRNSLCLRRILNDLLRILICESVVRAYYSPSEPLRNYSRKRCYFKDSRECELLFIRSE